MKQEIIYIYIYLYVYIQKNFYFYSINMENDQICIKNRH